MGVRDSPCRCRHVFCVDLTVYLAYYGETVWAIDVSCVSPVQGFGFVFPRRMIPAAAASGGGGGHVILRFAMLRAVRQTGFYGKEGVGWGGVGGGFICVSAFAGMRWATRRCYPWAGGTADGRMAPSFPAKGCSKEGRVCCIGPPNLARG